MNTELSLASESPSTPAGESDCRNLEVLNPLTTVTDTLPEQQQPRPKSLITDFHEASNSRNKDDANESSGKGIITKGVGDGAVAGSVTHDSGASTAGRRSSVGSGHGGSSGGLVGTTDALRRVTRVGRHAALTTKQAVWDSNELSIEAAVSAVDQWEGAYSALRSLLVHSVSSARGLYGAAKEGAGKLEHGLLMPVRDWVLLPAFTGAERAVTVTVAFLQSDTARQLAASSLQLARQVPVVGENVLAPAMCLSVSAVQRTWDVLQYPIPSREQVRVTVDMGLTTTKWALSAAAREVFLYAKRADAIITRTLSHTQWKVLGSGPYATLDTSNKRFVIDHLCERYFAVTTEVGRYELAAHVKRHNPALYFDLVSTGLLKGRGGDITQDDEWLSASPCYLSDMTEVVTFLLPREAACNHQEQPGTLKVSALWCYLPQVNGKAPSKDAPWVFFRQSEQHALEQKYRQVARYKSVVTEAAGPTCANETAQNVRSDANMAVPSCATTDESSSDQSAHKKKSRKRQTPEPPPPTIAQWYNVNAATDVMVDQQRHAVTFAFSCPTCHEHHISFAPLSNKRFGEKCNNCIRSNAALEEGTGAGNDANTAFALPPIAMIRRPTFWRFYGQGDEVRRATWFLDTARHGLQPFDYNAQAVLEDAYLFLKFISHRRRIDPRKPNDDDGAVDEEIDESLLTVEVQGPDGTDRLVQFSSLTRATAIQKGLGAAVAIFKRRVYRGAWLANPGGDTTDEHADSLVESLGATTVPDASLRSVLDPCSPMRLKSERRLVKQPSEEDDAALAVPADRLLVGDLAKHLRDENDGKIDHLCLIVHGIGEMLRSVDLFGLTLPNLSSVCGSMRSNHAEVQEAHTPFMYPSSLHATSSTFGRVEYLPVEWHESFAILTQRRAPFPNAGDHRNVMIKDVSLTTIPNMREFANDTLMDVLFFMSPEHHQIILDVVTDEMNLGTSNA
jgi:hypothetical protein